LQQPGVYLAVMRATGTYNYSQPATLFTLSDIGVSVHRYQNRLDVFTQALEGGKALEGSAWKYSMPMAECWPRARPKGRPRSAAAAGQGRRAVWRNKASRPACCA